MLDKLVSQKIKKIVFTGPESSGKTSLTLALAMRLGVPYVWEYARFYLESKGPAYTYEDYLCMAAGQLRWERLMEERLLWRFRQEGKGPTVLLCDTGALVLKIWGEQRFGSYPAMLDEALYTYDLFFLCRPDIPYEEDPLRENPHNREELYELYKQHLKGKNLPYVVLQGDWEQRLKQAVASVQSLSNAEGKR